MKGFTDRFRIDIRTEQEVTQILPESKQVEVKKLGTGETYTETYDKLVLSPGAEPLRPRIEGIESKKIFTLRNVPDTDTIKNYVNTEKPRTAVVVGVVSSAWRWRRICMSWVSMSPSWKWLTK